MKKGVIFFIICVIFASCINAKKNNGVFEKEFVDPCINSNLLKELFEYINFVELLEKTDSNKCFILEFLIDKEDSIIVISRNMCWMNYSGYKGIMNIDKYDIAILDKENIGINFYNIDSLVNKNLDNLQCNNGELRGIAVVKIKGLEIKSNNQWDVEGIPLQITPCK